MVIGLQRIEGLVIAIAATYFYGELDSSWLLFFSVFLLPDISLIGYKLGGTKLGALIYNLAHTLALAVPAAVVAYILETPHMLGISLVWVAHIGVDRALGYGLKHEDNFKRTHLGWVGKKSIVSEPQNRE